MLGLELFTEQLNGLKHKYMIHPQWPFKGRYITIQGYSDNAINYPEGHHGALDIVPLDEKTGQPYPADIYPTIDAHTVGVQNTSTQYGKGLLADGLLDQPFVDYLKGKGLIPKDYTGQVNLRCLYWHCLNVTDLDGNVDQNTPLAKAGNTGNVYHNGQPVPDSQKGVPPYPGLHLHFECILMGPDEAHTFNRDKDVKGRIDPLIILAYKGASMNQTQVRLGKDGKTVWICTPVSKMDVLTERASVEGFMVPNPIPPTSDL